MLGPSLCDAIGPPRAAQKKAVAKTKPGAKKAVTKKNPAAVAVSASTPCPSPRPAAGVTRPSFPTSLSFLLPHFPSLVLPPHLILCTPPLPPPRPTIPQQGLLARPGGGDSELASVPSHSESRYDAHEICEVES
eukprot:756456-Pyramimonas_sp.AAC.1